jgi:hypothetical protein
MRQAPSAPAPSTRAPPGWRIVRRPWPRPARVSGSPGDRPRARVKEGEQSKKFMFFAVGVQGANFETLAQISVREPLKDLLSRQKYSLHQEP